MKRLIPLSEKVNTGEVQDDKLWKVFSVFVRLRDADENGYCRCITSGERVHWKQCDAGHFIGRRHLSTKFDERNVNAQGRGDNRFKGGKQFEYSINIDKKWGAGTAIKLLIQSKQICKRAKFEIDELTKYYQKEVERLKREKNIE